MYTAEHFKKLSKQEKDRRLKIRYLAIYHFKKGANRTQIASYIGVARGSVNTWISTYLSQGIEGLTSKPNTGRPSKLTSKQKQDLSAYIKSNAVKPNGGRLIAEDITQYIETNFNVEYKQNSIYNLLHTLGFSWITSRSKHPKQSQECQDAFKKLPTVNDPSHTI